MRVTVGVSGVISGRVDSVTLSGVGSEASDGFGSSGCGSGVVDSLAASGVVDSLMASGEGGSVSASGFVDSAVVSGVVDSAVVSGVVDSAVASGFVDSAVVSGFVDSAVASGEDSVVISVVISVGGVGSQARTERVMASKSITQDSNHRLKGGWGDMGSPLCGMALRDRSVEEGHVVAPARMGRIVVVGDVKMTAWSSLPFHGYGIKVSFFGGVVGVQGRGEERQI